MLFKPLLTICAFIALASASRAEYTALMGKVIIGRCHMDVCSWFSVESVQKDGESPDGVLFKANIRYWESNHPNGSYDVITDRKLIKSTEGYAFCSNTRPGLIYKDDKDEWLLESLYPDQPGQIFGSNEYSFKEYWALCHSIDINPNFSDEVSFAKKFGYVTRPPSDFVEPTKLSQPEDVLGSERHVTNAQASLPATLLQKCSQASNEVKILIVKIVANSKSDIPELASEVALKDDLTIEDYNKDIEKLTCAVSYELNIRHLIGWLAEHGRLNQAYMLDSFGRRKGYIVSSRVKYSAKPLANGGSWIEILN